MKKINLFFIILLLVLILGCTSDNKNYGVFAQCLTDSGATLYGSFQCGHCVEQKEMFGNAIAYVNYVECGPLSGPINQVCIDEGLQAFPTWKFGDGTEVVRKLPLEELARRTGCELP